MTEQRPPEYPTLQHYQPSPFILPEETLPLRVARDHVPYDRWEQQGYLQTTEGNVVHYGYIERFIDALGQKFHIKEIAYDRWGAVQMVQNLEGLGFTVIPFAKTAEIVVKSVYNVRNLQTFFRKSVV